MRYEVTLKEEADADIFKGYKYYESQREGLGSEFLDEIEEHIKILENSPKGYQIRKMKLRYCPLKRFPYILVYEIEKQDVVIYAVFNTYQHPKKLKHRK